MYSPAERDRLRDTLVAAARRDERTTGAALTGSASVDRRRGVDRLPPAVTAAIAGSLVRHYFAS